MQTIAHFMLGAALAYANGTDPLAGGSAAVAAERAAGYLAKQYDDGHTAIDPITGKFNPNLLPEHIKEEIKAQTGALASVVGAAGGSLNGTNSGNGALFNAQAGGVLGQNAVENNYLTREELNAQVDAAVACRKGDKAACAEQKRLERLNKERDLRLLAECNANIRSPLCTRLRKEAEVAMSGLSATPLSRLFDFKMAFNPERRQAHSEEFGKTDTVVLMSYGKSPEEIATNAKMMRVGSELLTDMTVVGTIKDFKQADTFRDYAVATIFAIPGVKVAKKLETVRDFRKAYEAAKEAGDLRTAKELFELAKEAKSSPKVLEQIAVKEAQINVRRLRGKDFESWLQKRFGGEPGFQKGGRDFDGAIGNRWFEAKSGRYWLDRTSSMDGFNRFKSDMGDRLRIAREHNATYELHSNSPIPDKVKEFLDRKGIKYFEY